MSIKLHPYKLGSESCGLLSKVMGEKLNRKVWRVGDNYHTKPRDTVINWGNCHSNVICKINPQHLTSLASDKFGTLRRFAQHDVPSVSWTVDTHEVGRWLDDKQVVYARYSLRGSGGEGIKLFKTNADMAGQKIAPLYTKYFSAKHEYRVHVVNGQVIDFARKKKKDGLEGNKFIRNLENGYVFGRVDVQLPDVVADAAVRAVQALGLHFGAVDVLHNVRDNQAACLEVNTAPGLDNHTVLYYADALLRIAR